MIIASVYPDLLYFIVPSLAASAEWHKVEAAEALAVFSDAGGLFALIMSVDVKTRTGRLNYFVAVQGLHKWLKPL